MLCYGLNFSLLYLNFSKQPQYKNSRSLSALKMVELNASDIYFSNYNMRVRQDEI
jgi:hypothetical protein